MKFYSLLLVLFFSTQALCFINIESLRQSDKNGFSGVTGLKVNGAAGNTEKFNSKFSSQNIFQDKKNEILVLGNHLYGKASSKRNINKGQLHLRYAYYPLEYFAYETFFQVQTDEFKNLTYRQLLGLGLRTRLLNLKRQSLFLGAGSFFEKEKYEKQTNEELFRGNIYLSYTNSLNEKTNTFLIAYYQPSLEDFNDFRLRTNLGLDFKIFKNFSFSAELRYAFDSNVPSEVKKGDLVYFSGVNISY